MCYQGMGVLIDHVAKIPYHIAGSKYGSDVSYGAIKAKRKSKTTEGGQL